MKTFAIFLLLILVFAAYRWIVPVSYEKDPQLTPEEFECSRDMAHITMDNPIERIPLTKMRINKTHTGDVLATAYFLIFPYTKIAIRKGCNGAARI